MDNGIKRKKYHYVEYVLLLAFIFVAHIFFDVSPARAALTQNVYRWYYNADTVDPTFPIARENADPTIVAATSTPMHLRMNVTTSVAVGVGIDALKLQSTFSTSSGVWIDVTDPWLDGSLSHRRKITIGSTTAALTNFPLPIFLYSSSTAGNLINNIDYSRTQNSGQDIRFATASGTPLKYEIEKWDETGSSTVWVQIPSIATSTWPTKSPRQASSTYIWMYYGNTTTTSAATTTGVWDSNYVGVWHLNETATAGGTSVTHTDSTGKTNNGTQTNNGSIAGIAAGAQTFDGTGDYINVGDSNSLDLTSNMTLEAWASPNGAPTGWRALAVKDDATDIVYYLGASNASNIPANVVFASSAEQALAAGSQLDSNRWVHLVSTYDTVNQRLYQNGSQLGFRAQTGSMGASTASFFIGGHTVFSGEDFAGNIDEVRLSNVVRTHAWINATYNSISNPNFNTYGPEESYATSTVWRFANATSSPIATDNATTTKLYLTGSDQSESYEEASTTPGFLKALTAGQDGEFDFYLDPTQATTTNTYYFRLIRATSTAALETYTNYPAITIGRPDLTQNTYRWYDNKNAIQPDNPLAAENATSTLTSTSSPIRLRINTTAGSFGQVSTSTKLYTLQYALNTSGNWTNVGASTTVNAVWRFYKNSSAADGATTTSALLSDSDSLALQSYSGSTSTVPIQNTIKNGLNGEWDFSLEPNRAANSTAYYFRMFNVTDNIVLPAYTRYPGVAVSLAPSVRIASSTPARVTVGGGSTAVTTGNFYAPDNSLLLATVSEDTINAEDVTMGITNNGTALTWTQIVERDPGDVGATDGFAAAWYALVPTARTGLTVTASITTGGATDISIKVYVVTGHSTTTPIGASGEGTETVTNNITPTLYTSTADGSLGFGVATDWLANGAPGSTGDNVRDVYHLAGLTSGISAYKATTTATSSTAVIMNFDAGGAGAPKWNWVGFEVLPARQYKQSAYGFFNNADSTDVGTALAAQDTAATLASAGAAFRLRMLTHASSTLAVNQESFKLQFVGLGSGTCASPSGGTPSTYTDVSASTVIAFNNNATPADGASLTTNASDPTHGSDTVTSQTYAESNPVRDTTAVTSGRDGQWDFSLIDNSAPASTAYCFRMATTTADNSATGTFNAYGVYPQITTSAGGSTYTQRNFQWFLNANSVQPGTSKSNLNATTTDVDNGNLHRLRMDVAVATANLSANGQTFDLQYRAASTGCDTTGTWTNVGGATSTAIWIMYDNPGVADAATLTTALLNSSNVLQNYNESTTFINASAVNSGQAAEWDWGILNNGAAANTTYCFRITKLVSGTDTALDTYTNYPKLKTSGVTGGRGGGASTISVTPTETIATGAKALGAGTTTDPVAPSETPTTGGTKPSGGGDSAFTPSLLKSLANLIEGLLSFVRSFGNG